MHQILRLLVALNLVDELLAPLIIRLSTVLDLEIVGLLRRHNVLSTLNLLKDFRHVKVDSL
jgi:hypothetical protein